MIPWPRVGLRVCAVASHPSAGRGRRDNYTRRPLPPTRKLRILDCVSRRPEERATLATLYRSDPEYHKALPRKSGRAPERRTSHARKLAPRANPATPRNRSLPGYASRDRDLTAEITANAASLPPSTCGSAMLCRSPRLPSRHAGIFSLARTLAG